MYGIQYSHDELKNIRQNFHNLCESIVNPEFRESWIPIITNLIEQDNKALEHEDLMKKLDKHAAFIEQLTDET